MIARVRGEVLERRDGAVVVDAGGVGYLVHVPASTVVPPPGAGVDLHTVLVVREDAHTLYGFASDEERHLFDLLRSATGVGPRLALAALSALRPAALRTALADGDVAALTGVPGIGRKVAERLVLELGDRVAPVEVPTGTEDGSTDGASVEVRAALAGFGFTSAEITRTLREIGPADGEDAAALLRRALRHLGGGAEVVR